VKNPVEPEKTGGDPELAWRVLGLLNLYRLSVPSVLVVLSLLASRPQLMGAVFPGVYYVTLAAWFTTGVICIGLLKTRWPSLQAQAFIHIAFDVAAVTALLVTSAGAASGAGLLLIMPIAAVSLLLPSRTATTIAAIAAIFVLFQQIALWLSGLADGSELTQAGLLGGVIFFAALAVAPLARRLRESEELVRQRNLDLANLAELSQYIVERLRESLVVVDEHDRIRLINESARQILGAEAKSELIFPEHVAQFARQAGLGGAQTLARGTSLAERLLDEIPGVEKPGNVSEAVAALIVERSENFRSRFKKK